MQFYTKDRKMKQRKDLQPGVKYRGYGIVNAYGEFEFIPEETGSRRGKRRVIKMGNDFTISETDKILIFHITQQKTDNRLRLMKEYLETVNETLKVLRDYEI